MTNERMTVDVVIETPGGDHNRYVYDERLQAVRLSAVVRQRERRPFDWGTVPKTLGPEGRPLGVLLVVDQPTFAGCLVAARPVGLVELQAPDGYDRVVVAVPEADARAAEIEDLADLSDERLRALRTWLDGQHGSATGVSADWRGAAVAREVVRVALQAARLARIGRDRAHLREPLWKALFAPGQNGHVARATDANTEAERAVRTLPYRFQGYAEKCLAPTERILLHVQRAPLSFGGVPFLRRRQAHAGLLVLTDQQILFLTDVLPPGSSRVAWGFVARSAALERLRGAAVAAGNPYPRLEIEVEAAGGVERLTFEFPAAALPDLERAAALLRSFVPSPDDRRLRRLPAVADEPPSLARWDEEPWPPELVELLAGRLGEQLGAGEVILARALAPPWPERGLPRRLLALTGEHLFVVPEHAPVERHHLAQISSLELRNSLLGCYLQVAIPTGDEVQRLVVDVDIPSVPHFTCLYRTARQLLSTPLAWAAGETAPVGARARGGHG